jgi:hypothetical protein
MGTVGCPGEQNGLGVKLITQLRLVPRSRKRDICIRSPIRLHGVVLNVTFAVRLDFR